MYTVSVAYSPAAYDSWGEGGDSDDDYPPPQTVNYPIVMYPMVLPAQPIPAAKKKQRKGGKEGKQDHLCVQERCEAIVARSLPERDKRKRLYECRCFFEKASMLSISLILVQCLDYAFSMLYLDILRGLGV